MKNSDKRVTIGVEQDRKYVVYKFGQANRIEMEHREELEENSGFTYFKDDRTSTPPRNSLENISFTNQSYQYSLYSNYLETNLEKLDDVLVPEAREAHPQILKEMYEQGRLSEAEYYTLSDYTVLFAVYPRIPFKNGTGILVQNLKTGKKSFIEADESTIEGYMGLIKFW